MDTIQGAEYVQAVKHIDPRNMSRGMFRFVRAAARAANRSRPIEDRPEVLKFRFTPVAQADRTPAKERFISRMLAFDPYLQF